MSNDLKIGLQYCMPKHLLTRLVGKLAAAKAGFLTTAVIKWFIRQYKVEMSEAKNPDPASYPTFNDFFVRELKDGARPLNDEVNVISHPADAVSARLGRLKKAALSKPKATRLMPVNCWAAMPNWQKSSLTVISQHFTCRHAIPPCAHAV